ncbi:type IV secretory system conjugative DNA transfer family protein [Psychromarinibacter halotolerans]|uniref:Type IV secretory system conjugative DNA transfer family protein n=1 Tax=Psychromarinibacter halotolerans TaxID=1775175 RepID=A0ABV7H0L0_9RHOB|nr:type IV secretory system conjugative DNA transfer family protein [Psychromarinibacter halotolerans]MDF0596320.1 type IV secretory system conjugative DNA transfer family protein [Psychromarinibacter halotolerans]
MAGNQPKNTSPTGALLLGVSFIALAHYAPAMLGGTNAADDLYLGFFKAVGGITVLGSIAGYYSAWRQLEKRIASEKPSGVFGEASFATVEDCDDAGLLNPQGLYLGTLDGQPLFHSGKAHLLTCAPARQGKGINVVLPNLLHYTGSVVVTDPKGELAAVTAAHRRERFGQRVVVLNPWGLHGLPQDRINPLEGLIAIAGDPARQRGLTDEVKAIALQLLPEPEDTKNFYFREGSRTILRAVLLYLALSQPKLCTLPEAWRLVANPKRLARAVDAMCRSDALGGLLADLGDDLASQIEGNPDQFADFRAGAVQALDIFEPGGYLADAVSFSDIALADLKSGDVSIYLAFPQDRIASHGAALGLIVNQAITAVARSDERGQVLFLLDEFANMGKLAGLAESLTALPGLGVRVWMFVQELAELIRIYGQYTARTLLSQAEVKQFFSVQDFELARTLSQALGQKTVKTRNFNLGRLDTDEIGESLSETGRPLMAADEIRLMPRDKQLLLVNGLLPVKAQLVPLWFVSPWRDWAEPNPVEGDFPNPRPLFQLGYELKRQERK